MASAGLLLHGTSLISITGTAPYIGYYSPWATSGSWLRGTTNIEVLDVSQPERPSVKWLAQLDGHVLASRRIGDRLYVVTRFAPDLAGFIYGTSVGPSLELNRALLAKTPTTALLPAVRISAGAASPLVSPSHIYAPPQGARVPTADMVVVSAINLVDLRIAQAIAVLGSIDAVYVSQNSLYVTSSRNALRTPAGVALPEPTIYLSDVTRIRLGENSLDVAGTGTVEGYLAADAEKAQFRMSEFQDKLRVVTGSQVMWGDNKNKLTILEPSTIAPGLLRTVSVLPNAKRPESLGKPGELLYGVRFVNERLYAVTFKMIDPLYIVDLVDITDPRITGSVQMPGFAEYLHPLPNGMLLGFGKDAVPAVDSGDGSFAWYQGLLLTLYDVSNAAAPKEVQRVTLGMRGSDSILLRDHHAFSSLLGTNSAGVIAFPASINEGSPPLVPSPSYYYPWKQSGLMRYALGGTNPADMRLATLQPLITHSMATTGALYNDGARYNARSVLFGAGSVYLSNGVLWRLDRNGQQAGPY
jgi:Secreted protein containing C-terminal beta-propeller domain distantly related to WD-40 repeats